MNNSDPQIDELRFGRHTPQFNAVGMADVNYINGCLLDPLACL